MKIKLWKILLTVFLIVFFSFILAGRFLDIEQPLQKADVIIVLGGGDGERTLEASKLYKSGLAGKVILSNGGLRNHPFTSVAMQEIGRLKDEGVPQSAIIPELQSQSTYGNAFFTKKVMKAHHFKSAIVVSSSYHMRRAQYIFIKQKKEAPQVLLFPVIIMGGSSSPYFYSLQKNGGLLRS